MLARSAIGDVFEHFAAPAPRVAVGCGLAPAVIEDIVIAARDVPEQRVGNLSANRSSSMIKSLAPNVFAQLVKAGTAPVLRWLLRRSSRSEVKSSPL